LAANIYDFFIFFKNIVAIADLTHISLKKKKLTVFRGFHQIFFTQIA